MAKFIYTLVREESAPSGYDRLEVWASYTTL